VFTRAPNPFCFAHFEELPGVVLQATHEHQNELILVLLDHRHNVVRSQSDFAVARLQSDEGGSWVQAVPPHLRLQHMHVRRKRFALHQNLHSAAACARLVEGCHHEVQVDREAVHDGHFARFCAHESRRRRLD
jgi:hypothetical protein